MDAEEPGGAGRPYRMRARARAVAETRRRIVEATVALHGELGPAATTVSAIAERAGVTRVTVYRHFPDDEALFAACSSHWSAQQELPDVAAWAAVEDPVERLRVGLTDLYRYFRAGQGMLAGVHRDEPTLPASIREVLAAEQRHHRDVLVAGFDAHDGAVRRTRALVGHAVRFGTWHSLCVEESLSDREAVTAMVALVVGR